MLSDISGYFPLELIISDVVLWPKTPQKQAGILVEPPISDANDKILAPAATRDAHPPVEPPGIEFRSSIKRKKII